MGHVSVIGTLLCLVCVTTPARLPYIVGGNDSLYPGRWPWQGEILFDGAPGCGCSLIGDRWLVTAAHCTEDKDTQNLLVLLGAYDIPTWRYGAPKVYGVKKAHTHPDYFRRRRPVEAYNDIALLELEDPVEFNNYVATIQLPEKGANFEKSPCYITGWGMTNGKNDSESDPNILQEAATKELNYASCSDQWWVFDKSAISEAENICVAGVGLPKACGGDSGGPLVCKLGSTWYLAGATSRGDDTCELDSLSSVYTRISTYRSWIKSVSGV